jgi:DNA-binding response OmpR family regulator
VAEKRKILVIDDEQSVRDVATAYLQREGYSVHVAADGRAGLAAAERLQPALIVLDLMLPDVSGEEICRQIRERSDVPIVMLTAKGAEEERIDGLSLGADDYLVKPFSPRELVARVAAVLRRAGEVQTPLVPTLSFDGGRLQIDTERQQVTAEGRVVELTRNEYKLLVALASYPGRVYSRYELVDRVQGDDYDGFDRTIDAHVKNLRKKIEPDPRHPRYVETVVGAGYRLAKL